MNARGHGLVLHRRVPAQDVGDQGGYIVQVVVSGWAFDNRDRIHVVLSVPRVGLAGKTFFFAAAVE
jgi:hypothetical protein